MAKKSNVVALRWEDQPQFQNRKGPGGHDLDRWEAMAWFPPFEINTTPWTDAAVLDAITTPHHRNGIRLRYEGINFVVWDIEPSIEPGVFFGNIEQDLPRNSANLGPDQNIGFEVRHVFGAVNVGEARSP